MKINSLCSKLKDTPKRVKLEFIAMNKYLTLDSNRTAKTSNHSIMCNLSFLFPSHSLQLGIRYAAWGEE